MRSPLASEESGVGWPRVVPGDAAHMASERRVSGKECNTRICQALPAAIDMAGSLIDRLSRRRWTTTNLPDVGLAISSRR